MIWPAVPFPIALAVLLVIWPAVQLAVFLVIGLHIHSLFRPIAPHRHALLFDVLFDVLCMFRLPALLAPFGLRPVGLESNQVVLLVLLPPQLFVVQPQPQPQPLPLLRHVHLRGVLLLVRDCTVPPNRQCQHVQVRVLFVKA